MKEKLYYSITEVSKIVGVKSHVLRYWEKEFKQLCPKKTAGGRRIYTSKDIDKILLIKKLLYEEKYSIDGAKKKLNETKVGDKFPPKVGQDTLKEIEEGLKSLLQLLS